MKRIFITSFFSLLCAACSQQDLAVGHPIITAYGAAYNAKDIDALSALMHPDIEWLSVNGNDIDVAVKGKADLVEGIQTFFADPNMATGSHKGWSFNGNYVAVTETASWTTEKGQAKSQSALTVYQLEDDLVRRVYYYPVQKGAD